MERINYFYSVSFLLKISMSSEEEARESSTETRNKTVSFNADEEQAQCVKFSLLGGNRLAASFTTEFGHQGLYRSFMILICSCSSVSHLTILFPGEGYVYVLERNDDTGELEKLIKIDYRDNIFDVSCKVLMQ